MKAVKLFLLLWLVPVVISGLVMFLDGGFKGHVNWNAVSGVIMLLAIPAFGVAFLLPILEKVVKSRLLATATAVLATASVSVIFTGFYRNSERDDLDIAFAVFQAIFCICLFLISMFLTRISSWNNRKQTFRPNKRFFMRAFFWICIPEFVFCSFLLAPEFQRETIAEGYSGFLIWVFTFSLLTNAAALLAIWLFSRNNYLSNRSFLGIFGATAAAIFTGLIAVSFKIQVAESHLGGILMTLLFPCLFSSSAMMFLKQKAESDAKDSEIRNLGKSFGKKSSELEILKRQTNPHFFFNNLNMLISLIESDPKKASEFGQRLAKVYRKFFSENEEDFVALTKELDFISEYIEIYRAKFGDSFTVSIKPEYHPNYHILSDALQEMIDNIFKHNVFEQENPISIEIFRDDANLIIRNSRIPKIISDSQKTGLENIRKRYELLTGAPISVSGTDEIFVVNLPILSFE